MTVIAVGARVVVVVDREEQAGTVERPGRVMHRIRLDDGRVVSRYAHEIFDLFNDERRP
jgi:hypothetical protein